MSLPRDGACEDGDPCTGGDHCVSGSCVSGDGPGCDDGNPCTKDACLPGVGCLHQALAGVACDDGSVCTLGEACEGGACKPALLLPCDDGSLCTADGCDPVKGCVHALLTDLCVDENPCTAESCDPKLGCVQPNLPGPCDDGNACTTGDHCEGGACVAEKSLLDDGNPCTDDLCDAAGGVSHVANALPCSDGDACTLGDGCEGGACVPGAGEPACDDGNLCTIDTCVPSSGCAHVANAIDCDDGTDCTEADHCQGGACKGVALGCDDDNPCTFDTCDDEGGCVHELEVTNACRPQIEVTYPARAATLVSAGAAYLFVQGKVTSGGGKITSLKLNGVPAQVGFGGSFNIPYQPQIGGNTLVFEAVDASGGTRKRVQSFLLAKGYNLPVAGVPKSGMADPGMGLRLDQEVLDDGVHTLPPDDLATIFELAFEGFDIAGLVDPSTPVGSQLGYDIYIQDVTDQKRTASLSAGVGRLDLKAVVSGLHADVWAPHPILPDLTGDLTATAIVIQAGVYLDVVDHALVTTIDDVSVEMEGVVVDIAGDLGLVDWVLSFFIPGFIEDIEASFETEMVATLEPMLAGALQSLALSFDFELPSFDPDAGGIPVSLQTDFSSVTVSPATGLTLVLRAGAYAEPGNAYENLGALARFGCGTGLQKVFFPKSGPLELALADDAVNEILYAAWKGGLLETDLPPSLLAGQDLGKFGITELDVHLSALLQPTASDCNAEGELRVHLGDLRIDAEATLLGQVLHVVLHASVEAGLSLEVDPEAGEVVLALGEVESFAVQVDVEEEALLATEPVLEDLVETQLVPALLAALGGSGFGGFPLPEIDLSGAVPGLPPGTVIAIDPQEIARISGNTVVSGDLK